MKQIKGIEKQKQEHEWKLENLEGRKDTTPAYWQREIESFEKQKLDKIEKLEKVTGKKLEELDEEG